MIVMLAGPIDYWWNENWETPFHEAYRSWRTAVNRRLVEAGHLVYRPHEAFKGAWDERAQRVNYAAIDIADLLLNLRPPGVPAYGTEAEVKYALESGCPVYDCPPGTDFRLFKVLLPRPIYLFDPLNDPYGKVHRKSYSRLGGAGNED